MPQPESASKNPDKGYLALLGWSLNAIEALDRNWGVAAFRAQRYAQAAGPLERQLRRDAADLTLREMLGVSYFMLDDFQHSAQVINLLDIFQRELGYGDAAMNAALEQPFERQNARGFSHRVARDAERSCQRDFLQWHSRAQLTFQDPLAQDGRDLIRNTDPVNLRALHENVDWERNAKSRAILLPLCSRCQVLNNSMSYHIRNVPGLSTIEMSPGYHAGEKAGVFIFCQPCLQG